MLHFFLLLVCLSGTTGSEVLSRHKRTWIIRSFSIEEAHPGPYPYVLDKINIRRDDKVYFDLFGQGVDEEPRGVFSMDTETGTLYAHRAVDYERNKMLKLSLETRKVDYTIDTRLGIEVTVLDINDNPPLFQKDVYVAHVKEEEKQGSSLLTVFAIDRDQAGTPNSTFHYEIKSVSPNPSDTAFVIDTSGTISFRGCLNREVAEKFTLLVEARDHGEVVSLSSSTTVVIHVEDGNNNLPTITGQTGSGKVKERETGTSPLRLHVTDKDTPNSPAWRAKYTIHGDEGRHFKIETDPETNDGILTVVKPLDFEEASLMELSISVENEVPYFSCKVTKKTSSGLWNVTTGEGGDPGAGSPHSVKVLVDVEDVNDPPMFSETIKEAALEENAPVGTWVEKVTAVDHDSSHARNFLYRVGHDPAGWLKVDPNKGDITTVKIPDRESPHVVNGVYTALLHAVDNGNPPATGTSTLQIHVTDQNDNVPRPTADKVDLCLSDMTTNITAFDPDGSPYSGPFSYELLGDVAGKWKLDPSHGYSAGLVKEPGVYAHRHTIRLKISDMQGKFGIYNVTVVVCDCSVTANCGSSHRHTATKAALGAIGIVIAALVLLLVLLLLVVGISCKKEFAALQTSTAPEATLLTTNTETPGTDCQIPDSLLPLSAEKKHRDASEWQSQYDGMQQGQLATKGMRKNSVCSRREDISYLFSEKQTNWNSLLTSSYREGHQIEDLRTANLRHSMRSHHHLHATLQAQLQRKLRSLPEPEESLQERQPHVYADEGDLDNLSELDSITFPDDDAAAYQKALNDLGPEFLPLASICRPPHSQH